MNSEPILRLVDNLNQCDAEEKIMEAEGELDLDSELKAADELLRDGKWRAAIERLEEAAAKFPNSPQPLHDLGVAYLTLLDADIEQRALWEDQTDEEEAYQSAYEAFSEALE